MNNIWNNKIIQFKSQALKGNVEAQYRLGNHYFCGKGVKKNIKQALYWFKISANRKYKNSQYFLYNIHQNGLNVKQGKKCFIFKSYTK
jgi:TPR repeat protein